MDSSQASERSPTKIVNEPVRTDNEKQKQIKNADGHLSKTSYLIGLAVIFAAAYSQYLVDGLGLVLGLLVVYGIPVLILSLLWGSTMLRKALSQPINAFKYGLGFFGAFTLLGALAGVGIFLIIVMVDPSATNLLQRPNPVLQVPPALAWIMVWLSLLIVGPVEEYLFRGFMYGGLVSLSKGRHWLSLAFLSSIMFAAAHPYYGIVYGVASVVPFTELVTFGMAMAITYYLSGGNLIAPALVHGVYDATAFIGVATSLIIGGLLRVYMIIVGIIIGIVLIVQRTQKREPTPPPQ